LLISAPLPYRPVGHWPLQAAVVLPPVPNKPAGQFVHAAAPAVLYCPAVHWPEHVDTPMAAVAPNWPAAQTVHVPAPAREYCPAAQVAWVADADPAAHAYPALQLPVHPAVVKPVVDP
jgi:hypothetical protein